MFLPRPHTAVTDSPRGKTESIALLALKVIPHHVVQAQQVRHARQVGLAGGGLNQQRFVIVGIVILRIIISTGIVISGSGRIGIFRIPLCFIFIVIITIVIFQIGR